MAFEATKRELGELYTFFRLLADGKVFGGTPKAQKDDRKCWPIALIQSCLLYTSPSPRD